MARRGILLALRIIAALFAIGFFLAIGYVVFVGTVTITLSQEDVQARINEKLPKTFAKDKITVDTADVELAQDQLSVDVHITGEELRQKFEITASVQGTPRYDTSREAFYLTASDVLVEDFSTGATDKVKNTLDRLTSKLKRTNAAIHRAEAKVEGWVKTKAARATELVLDVIPVYVLKNDLKGIVAKASLDSVKVTPGKLSITFSLWRLTWWAVVWFIAFIAAIATFVALLRRPDVFLSLLFLDAIAS
jgi:hypothetical protein